MESNKQTRLKAFLFGTLMLCMTACISCNSPSQPEPELPEQPEQPVTPAEPETPVPDGKYNSYEGLVMAGYQGWFNTPDDGMQPSREWYHYQKDWGQFLPGTSTIDFWPDVAEYEKTYATRFKHPDGQTAYVYSNYDESTVLTHFRWMEEYLIDGVFMQRFVGEVASNNPSGKKHFDAVFDHAVKGSTEYGRAICAMYDLSGGDASSINFLLDDARALMLRYELKNRKLAPNYLFHNRKPLFVIWGVGFNDGRKYSLTDVERAMTGLRELGCSVMLGVPTYWRELRNDAVNDYRLIELIKKADIIMPWFVGRYGLDNYESAGFMRLITDDIAWCKTNNVAYAPLCFPGSSDRNMHPQHEVNPRVGGKFLWKQIYHCIASGAKMLYIAMFDEIDEGTAIYKCLHKKDVPSNLPSEVEFQGIEDELPTDHYLWLTGQGAKMLRKEIPLNEELPLRK